MMQHRPLLDSRGIGFLSDPTRYAFFTGKGGVRKTSLSAATTERYESGSCLRSGPEHANSHY
jgi:hypothetical protein